MKDKEIEYGNNLIAKFMESDATPNLLEFHENWQLLIPVIEKIENTFIDGMQLSTQIEGNSCVVLGTHVFCEGKTKIEATWKASVKFIKWYNENYKKIIFF